MTTMGEAIALGAPTAGRMSKRARKAAIKRLGEMLFPDGFPQPTCQQPTEKERLMRHALELRKLAARGMKPLMYKRKAAELEAQAEKL